MKKKKRLLFLLSTLVLMLAAGAAFAQEADEITAFCKVNSKKTKGLHRTVDGNYQSVWTSASNRDAYLILTAPEDQKIASVYLQFSNESTPFEVQVKNEQDKWVTAALCETNFLTNAVQLETPAQSVRIIPLNRSGRLMLAEIHAFAPGDLPSWVHHWEAPLTKSDLLVLAAHPDDELLFMGGTIPYYAGELQLDVQVAYLSAYAPYRKLELLDGLWTCGVTHYPLFGGMPDVYNTSLNKMYSEKGWNEDRVLRFVVGLYRSCRPEVVVTHDVHGEYGHGAHKVAADAAQKAIELAASPDYQHKKLAATEPWQIKKLYLHLYEDNAMQMNWRQPLKNFDGKTALDVAAEAFTCHKSQDTGHYHVEDFGPNDNSKFGLAFTTVGEDVEKNDFMENIK